MKARIAALALVVPLAVVAAPAYAGGGGGDYCEVSHSDYCEHQPPGQGETRVLIRGHKLKLTQDNRLWVELRCAGQAGEVCHGNLYLRARKLVGAKDFRIDAGSAAAVPVRVSADFARELREHGRVPLSAVARQDGVVGDAGTTAKKMLAVADRGRHR